MTGTQQASDDEGIALTKIHGAEEEAPSVGHEAASPSNRTNERSAEVQLNNGWVGKRISVGGVSGGIRGGISFHHHDQEPSNLHVNSDGNDEGKVLHEAITLPQSTHTLLFTEKVFSIPFAFAFLVLALSISCLALALCDNLAGNTPDNPLKVPSNVTPSVRAAQFLSIVIAVLMEEEIPTGLYLLRVIPRSTVEGILGVSYWKFAVSAMIRLVIGYMFLSNVLLVIIQSEGVLDMFYDMLALQFVSMIDDISFKLAQLDILGKSLRNAAAATCFRTELERRPYLFRKKMTIFVKSVFALNFLFLLACITSVTIFQKMGHFQCEDITVTFGDHIWEESWVETGPGEHKNMVLVYSFFNGVYRKTGTQDGRPVYKELRKSEDSHFGYRHTGAEIKYCKEERVWAFTHEKIKKTQFSEETSCPWLVRSPDTDAYDLLDVSRDWEVWVGVINHDAEM